MKRTTRYLRAVLVVMCAGVAWLGNSTDAKATQITDTFEVTMTGKQWCEGNPALFEGFKIRVTPNHPEQNTKFEFMQDPQNIGDLTDIQATLDTQGASPELDAMTLKGRAFPNNKAGRLVQFVLSGTNPNQPTHYLTLQGQAIFDKTGHPVNVSGKYSFQIISTYTTNKKTGAQSESVECFNNGIVATKGKQGP